MMKTKYIKTQSMENTTQAGDAGSYPLNYIVYAYLLSENKVVEMPILEAFVLALRLELRKLKFVITDQQGEELIKSDGNSVIVANQIDKEFFSWRSAFIGSIDEGVQLLLQQQLLNYQAQLEQAKEQMSLEAKQKEEELPTEVTDAKMENLPTLSEEASPAKLVSWDTITIPENLPEPTGSIADENSEQNEEANQKNPADAPSEHISVKFI